MLFVCFQSDTFEDQIINKYEILSTNFETISKDKNPNVLNKVRLSLGLPTTASYRDMRAVLS